jgi:hypothetical protein
MQWVCGEVNPDPPRAPLIGPDDAVVDVTLQSTVPVWFRFLG